MRNFAIDVEKTNEVVLAKALLKINNDLDASKYRCCICENTHGHEKSCALKVAEDIVKIYDAKYIEKYNKVYHVMNQSLYCYSCDSVNESPVKENISYDGHYICESDMICTNCNKLIAHWSYGFFVCEG